MTSGRHISISASRGYVILPELDHYDNFATGRPLSILKGLGVAHQRQASRPPAALFISSRPAVHDAADAPCKTSQRWLGIRNGHLAMGPVFEISDCKAFEKWVGFNELLSIGSACCVGAGHHRGGVGIL